LASCIETTGNAGNFASLIASVFGRRFMSGDMAHPAIEAGRIDVP
jgi:hypothetical protein